MDTFPVIISFSDSTNGFYFESTQFEYLKKEEEVILIRLSLINEQSIKLLEILIGIGVIHFSPRDYLFGHYIPVRKVNIEVNGIIFKDFSCTSMIPQDYWEEIQSNQVQELEIGFAKDF